MKNALVILMLAVLPLYAHAAKKAVTREVDTSSYQTSSDEDDAATTAPRASSRAKLTSEEKRADKNFSLLVMPIGFASPGTLDGIFGLSAGYFVTPNLVLSIDYSNGYNLGENVLGSRKDSTNTIGFHAKYFVVSSLYLKGGVFYRTIDSTETDSLFYSSTYRTNGDEIGAEIAIGNEWQFKKFTLGCDWISLAAPIQVNLSSDQGAYSVSASNLELGKLYVGVAF